MGILNDDIYRFRCADFPFGKRRGHFQALTVASFAYKYQTGQFISQFKGLFYSNFDDPI